jgi:Rrf2 family protein
MFDKTTEYAIRAMVYIFLHNARGSRPGFREIANRIGAPEEFMGKVLQTLVKAHLLSSVKGPGGGFYFKEPDKPITLLQIVTAFQGDSFFYRCGFGLTSCSDVTPCPLHKDYAPVREKLRKIVSESSVQLLASRIQQKKASLNNN